MADVKEYDSSAGASRQADIVREAKRIRDGLNVDVINWYADGIPKSDAEERDNRAGLRKHLLIARDRINDLLDRLR